MIENAYTELFWKENVDKQWEIKYDGGDITNVELFSQSIEISESLCSETELRFGCCEASCLKFKVANIVKPLINDWLTVSVVLAHQGNEPMVIGRYKVASDKPTSDRRHREIVAYDTMYDIINADVAAWYNSILPAENSTVTLKQFRKSFVRQFGLEEVVPDGGLVNDNMTVERTVDPEQMSGLDVITAICEINGCFGHIGRDGKFHYIYLLQAIEGLYPADDLFPDHAPEWMVQAKTGHLYPQDPKGTRISTDNYIECRYEDYRTKPITKLQIRQEENDIGKIWPEGDVLESNNCYIIQDNFLVYGKSSEQLAVIAENIFSKITDIVYRPFDSDCVGNPCFEVGDPVRLPTKYEIVESYILQRTLKGIQALRDDYQANGVEKYSEEVNGVQSSIIQLKGKSNVLERTVEENRIEMIDITNGLSNEISITAEGLKADIKNEQQRAENEENKLSNSLKITAEGLQANIDAEINRAGKAEEKLSTDLSATAEGLQADITAERNRAEGEESKLSNKIAITAEGLQANINAEKSRAEGKEESLGTEISALAGEVVLKVRANGEMATVALEADAESGSVFRVNSRNLYLSAEDVINLLSGGTINLSALNINITSDNWSASSNGDLVCNSITAFQIKGNAVTQFNSAVSDSEAMRIARQAIENAADAAKKAQEAADIANSAIHNLNNTIIPQINASISITNRNVMDLANSISALEGRVSALEKK